MGDDYYRLTPVKVRQILHYGTFIVGIQRIRRLIEKEIRRVLINRPGDQDPLTLALAYALTIRTYHRIIF